MSSLGPVPDKLATINAHERDQYIHFEEEGHIYTIHGSQDYTSCTTFIHQQFPHFDADACIDKMMANEDRWKKHALYGKTKDEIKEIWRQNGEAASKAGTQTHYNIECTYNDVAVADPSPEYEYFLKYKADFEKRNPGTVPYRTEWTVFHEEAKICGSIDMVYLNPDGTLRIYDWKRVKSIEHESFGDKCATNPLLSHLPDSNFWHYSLQLNIYKKILETKYDKKITELYLVALHPDNPYKTYIMVEAHDLSKEVDALFEQRIQTMNKSI